MTVLEEQLSRIAAIQRKAGWSQESITSYAKEISDVWGELIEIGDVIPGSGLAQDNTRHGVANKPA